MIMDFSFDSQIEALLFCADIFDYPTNKALDNFNSIIEHQFGRRFTKYDEIEAEYIRIFSMQATLLKCVPYASWWIDGKMSGPALAKINDFYIECGYRFDVKNMKKPADHVSFMLRFVAILAEDERYAELSRFMDFLDWFERFVDSLKKATDLEIFPMVGEISLSIINSLKEEV